MSELVKLTIDGKEIEAPKGMLLVEAAKLGDIEIPIFCHHPKMDPVGVCRMCLVEVEGQRKPITACTMPVSDGMVVKTETELVDHLRKGVLEFLLLNHPLDCPVCDKGGECPLQDNTFKYGPAMSRLSVPKMRKNKAVDLGNFIVLDEERCILCRRCTRFDDEIAHEGNLVVGERAHEAMITTANGQPFNSYFSGNTIEMCPVGALTSDIYRFKARPWDLSPQPSVCTGCSMGCNVQLDFRFGELLRVVSRDNPEVDNGWICDKGRFNYRFVHSEDRIQQPLVRRDGELTPSTWGEALQEIGRRLKSVRAEHGADSIGAIGGGRLTNEEAYLFQKLARAGLGTPHVDHRIGEQVVASAADYPGVMADVDDADVILTVDVLPRERVPVLDLRIGRAIERQGAQLFALGTVLPHYRAEHTRLPLQPGQTAAALAEILAALPGAGKSATDEAAVLETAAAHDLAAALAEGKKIAVLWGGEDPATGEALLDLLAAVDKQAEAAGKVHLLIPGVQNNARGAEAMGMLPGYLPGYRSVDDTEARAAVAQAWQMELPAGAGMSTDDMLQAAAKGNLQALYLAGANLALTYPDGALVRNALAKVPFLIVQDLFLTETAEHADVVLPAAPFPAKQGTYTAFDGRVQSVQAVMDAGGASQPDGDIFVRIAEAVGAPRLVSSAQEFRWELEHLVGALQEGDFLAGGPARDLLQSAVRAQADTRSGATDAAPGSDKGAANGSANGAPVGTPSGAAGQGADLILVPVDRLYTGGGTSHFDPGFDRTKVEAMAYLHPDDANRLQMGAGDSVELTVDEASLTCELILSEAVVAGTMQVPRGMVTAPVNTLVATGWHPVVTVSRRVVEEVS